MNIPSTIACPSQKYGGGSDPAAVSGSPEQVARAFREAFEILRRRIELFVNLPVASLDRMSLKKRLDDIGKSGTRVS